MLQELLTKIDDKDFTIGIVGLGYVGLPLMWTFHQENMPVLGFDIDREKVDCINEGRPYIKHLGKEMMQSLSESERCDATTDFERLAEADAILLCVPTPLNEHREPDMQYVERTCFTVGEHLRDRKSTRLNSSHVSISYAVFCLKKNTKQRSL